ncbi:MAG TPA: TonB-dependent receptor [Ferruginibacter sp.]|nr:TonB-dependent receptor [Ferruginibacter sp.]
MNLKISMLCLGILLGTFFLNKAFGQNITVNGSVINKQTGNPVIGASVNLQGTTISTSTDATGNFTISVPKGGKITITSINYSPETLQINKEESVTVLLQETTTSLDEVIVIGYGTRKITKVSAAISTVKSADIQRLSPVRIEQAIQGSASGVSVIQSGTPGSKPTLFIRGIPGLGSSPSVIVDGIPQTLDDLNSINAADIESVSVLKDAAGTAIYGVKGGNGVIVITTKSGRKNQPTEFVFNSSYGIQQVIRKMPLLNAAEYGAILNEGSTLSGGNIIFPNLSTLGKGTDWQDEVFRNAPEQNYNISARGGSDKLTYFLGGGYLSQAGIVGGYNKSRFDRMNFTTNVNYSLTKKLKFLLNASYHNLSTRGVPSDAFNGVLGNALNFDPTVSKYNTVPNTIGEFGFSNLITQEIQNPLTQLSNTYNENKGNKFYGKFEFQYDVLKNLKFTTRFGYTKYDANSKTFNPLQFLGPNNIDPNNTLNADGTVKPNRHNSVSHDNYKNLNYTYEAFANYDFKVFKNHRFETVVGIALGKESGNQQGVSRDDVPFNSWEYADYNAATGVNSIIIVNGQPQVYTAIRGYYFQYFKKNASGFFRINYDYNDKYLASFSGRRDGSTRFGADKRFGNFYAGSLGWVASKENFFKSKFINFLKIRGSYGVTGSDEAVNTNYAALSTIQTDYLASLYGTGNTIGYTFGNVFANGATLGTYANPLLGWESNTQANAGFEMNFHKNKFNISADYYYKKTKDLLFTTNLSSYLGSIPSPVTNIGTTNTSGIDISLVYNETIGKDLKLNSTLTFTTVKGKVTSTGASGAIPGGNFFNGQSQNTTLFAPGYAPGVYFGYRTDGLFQTQAEIDALTYVDVNGNTQKTYPTAAPGDIRYKDLNGDNILDSKDQEVIGSPFPKFTSGLSVNLNYKNFDLSVFAYASYGNDVVRAFERNNNFTNKYSRILERWTGPGTTNDAKNPRYSFTDPNNNARFSDRYVEDASFLKIKNILLGYTLPFKAVKKTFKTVRIYAQVKNAFVFTKYDGFDPEIGGNGLLNTGVDRGAYPLARSYAVGLEIKF